MSKLKSVLLGLVQFTITALCLYCAFILVKDHPFISFMFAIFVAHYTDNLELDNE